MSNLTDFIGGFDATTFSCYGGLLKENNVPAITDGVNNIDDATNTDTSNYLEISTFKQVHDGVTLGTVFSTRVMKRQNVIIKTGVEVYAPVVADNFFMGLEATNLIIDGSYGKNTAGKGAYGNSPVGFMGNKNGTVGTNLESGSWNYMPKGGGGIVGASKGGTNSSSGGYGGGLVLVIADNIWGQGYIRAMGYGGDGNSGSSQSGGGGIVIIITKTWSGTVGIDVSGGARPTPGDPGSYCILRANNDNSLTLMVHSENGVSADLNGQTPVFGKFANVPYDTTTPLTPSSVTAGTDINIAVNGTAQVDSVAIHGDSKSPYLTYTSSDTGVATVDGDGLVTGVAAGTCTITATSVIDGTKSNTTTVTVA